MDNGEFLKPESVLEVWDVRPGDKIADFGCGAGFFVMPLAQRVGSQGKIYALDIRPEALEATRAKARLFHLLNVDTIRADLEMSLGSGLKNESVDKILIANILFQAENKNALIVEALRILKVGGSLAVIEWSDEKNIGGPSLDHRLGKSETKQLFEKGGFAFFKEFNAGSHHYGLIFKK